jgi:hypothetical protein
MLSSMALLLLTEIGCDATAKCCCPSSLLLPLPAMLLLLLPSAHVGR